MRRFALLFALSALLFAPLAEAAFVPVGFTTNANSSGLSGGGSFPTGPQVFLGVPVNLGPNLEHWSGAPGGGSGTKTLTISVGLANAQNVYTAINSYWGQAGPSVYATISFVAGNGHIQTEDLIGNYNLRDYNQFTWTNSLNPTSNAINLWTNGNQRLDGQQWVLDPIFASEGLDTIIIEDNGATNFQRLAVFGVTVESFAEAVPAPVAGGLLAFGLALVLRRR